MSALPPLKVIFGTDLNASIGWRVFYSVVYVHLQTDMVLRELFSSKTQV